MLGRPFPALFFAAAIATAAYAGDAESSDTFFERLSSLCGTKYEGTASFPEDGPFSGETLVAEFAVCDENEVRIPFAVGADRSRTWLVTRDAAGLLLKHDHRHEDGTPDEITMYGGRAVAGGSALAQWFAADEHTRELIPEASTNVWTLSLSPDADRLTYYLERHGAPRFRAELERVETSSDTD